MSISVRSRRVVSMARLFFGVMAAVLFSALVLVGCSNDDDTFLDGTWVGVDNDWMYVFSGSNFTLLKKDSSTYINRQKGRFFITNAKTRYTQKSTHNWEYGSWVSHTFDGASCDIVIWDDGFTLTNDGESGWSSSYFTETYAKQ